MQPIRSRSIGMDLLRLYAALWVLLFHWSGLPGLQNPVPDWMMPFASEGGLGVDIFFMLSGAVIVHTAAGRSWQSFSSARFLRLFPVYFAATLILAIWTLIVSDRLEPTDMLAIAGVHFWFGTESLLPPAWTLYYEITFYLLIAVLLIFVRSLTERQMRYALMGLLVVCLPALITQDPILGFLTLQPFGPLFALGALLGISTNSEKLRSNLPAILFACALSFGTLLNRTNLLVGTAQVVVILVLLIGVSAVILLGSRTIEVERPQPRIAGWIATLSLMTYPLYLIHLNFGNTLLTRVSQLGIPILATWGIVLALLLAVCLFSVKVYEPWARRQLTRLFRWHDLVKRRPAALESPSAVEPVETRNLP